MKYILIMYICSGIAGNDCRLVETDLKEFKDHHECAVYGYSFTNDYMSNFSKNFVNDYKAYFQFACSEQPKTRSKINV